MRYDEGYRGGGNRDKFNLGNIFEIKLVIFYEKLDVENEEYILG